MFTMKDKKVIRATSNQSMQTVRCITQVNLCCI